MLKAPELLSACGALAWPEPTSWSRVKCPVPQETPTTHYGVAPTAGRVCVGGVEGGRTKSPTCSPSSAVAGIGIASLKTVKGNKGTKDSCPHEKFLDFARLPE